MTDALAYPLVNGYRYSWASIKISVFGEFQRGVTEISYKATVDRAEARGYGRHNLGFTRGDIKHESSITFLKEEYNNFIEKLGSGYMDRVWGTTVDYAEGDKTHTDTLVGCRLGEEDHSHNRGTEALTVKCKLHLIYWLHDGLSHVEFGPTQ